MYIIIFLLNIIVCNIILFFLKKLFKVKKTEFFIFYIFSLFIISLGFIYFKFDISFFCFYIFFMVLLIASFIDLKLLLVPNKIIFYPYFIMCFLIFFLYENPIYYLLSSFLFFMFFYIIYLISNKNIGGADIKMFLLIAIYMGFMKSLYSLFFSSIIATIFNFYLLFDRKNIKKPIPMMPYIFIGTLIAYFFIK